MLSIIVLAALGMALQADEGPGWARYESKEGRFSVEMLGNPIVETERRQIATLSIPVVTTQSTDGRRAFTVSYVDYPEAIADRPPGVILDGLRKAVSTQGKVIKETDLTLDGYPGREIAFEQPALDDPAATIFVRGRRFVVGNRIYLVESHDREPNLSSAEVDRWLDSFRLRFPDGVRPAILGTRSGRLDARRIGGIVDAAIPLVAGIFATMLGARKVGRRPGEDPNSDRWHERWDRSLRILGPLLIAFAVFQLASPFVLGG